jgi:hypothetical protein
MNVRMLRGGLVSTAINLESISDDFLRFAWLNLAPEARARILANSPKTCWLFGAGASYHYDLNAFGVPVPLANGFFKALHKLPTSQGFHALIGPFVSFLNHYRGVSPEKAGEWDENIEDFMNRNSTDLENQREIAVTSVKNLNVLSHMPKSLTI